MIRWDFTRNMVLIEIRRKIYELLTGESAMKDSLKNRLGVQCSGIWYTFGIPAEFCLM